MGWTHLDDLAGLYGRFFHVPKPVQLLVTITIVGWECEAKPHALVTHSCAVVFNIVTLSYVTARLQADLVLAVATLRMEIMLVLGDGPFNQLIGCFCCTIIFFTLVLSTSS